VFPGDIERSANAVASQRGINKVIAQVLPKTKRKAISKLQDQEKKIVATVGDGIDDAPTLVKPI
jgi:P-type Cu+ transporter